MSVDFASILGHSLDNSSIYALPERWNADSQLAKATARYCQFLIKKGWFPLLSPDDTWCWQGISFRTKWHGTNPEEIWNGITMSGPGLLSELWKRGSRMVFRASPILCFCLRP